jgi:hypothetical protein
MQVTFFINVDDFYLMETSFELVVLTMLRYVVQTCAVLNNLLWSKSWDAVIIDFYYTLQRKQPSNFEVYRCKIKW